MKRITIAFLQASILLQVAPATASPSLSITAPSAMPLAAEAMSQVPCKPVYAPTSISPVRSQAGKSEAILGVQMSALARMKLAQSGAAVPTATPVPAPAIPATINAACNAIGTRQNASLAVAPRARPTGQFLGTERVRIGRTQFDASWDRVSTRPLSRHDMSRSIGYAPRQRGALLAKVNRWVNSNIEYRDDRVQYGTSDYWADAKTTLHSRVGDCEDYAILKMQMLRAAGIDREEMMLTLARDTTARTDHAVLLVKNGNDWVILDMANDRIAPAGLSYGYRPVISFSANSRYLHGVMVTG
ncbi:transglutaminase-like cysteine peptidase [Altererythrobacter sp.]|uniref:transglutaminase-like cysteine peptidase n=1 Tax=Altererythrobacter sp. TaxID=1872480 RepID=UPI001B01BC1F|nr:transglutaminase-like cysteine peptidase [Altererythrobacter sp.]MBO6945188.1 transglutaminase-like cysteine peptidase [Altererythrobacter sp.]